MAAGACKCPIVGPSDSTRGQDKAPSPEANAISRGAAATNAVPEPPKAGRSSDLRSTWHAGGGGGGGGPGGPGGDGSDHDAQAFELSGFSQDRPGFGRELLTKSWRKYITFYLHSKNRDLVRVLRWAEQEREPVTAKTLGAARRGHMPLARLTEDPEVLSYNFWGFLNASLVKDACAMFAGVDMENGIEFCRTVVLAAAQKS